MVAGDLAIFDGKNFISVPPRNLLTQDQISNIQICRGNTDFKIQGTGAVFTFNELTDALREMFPERFI